MLRGCMGVSWERIGYIFHFAPKVYSTWYGVLRASIAGQKVLTSKLCGRQSYDAGHLEHKEPQYSPPLVAQPGELTTSNGAQRICCIPLFLTRSISAQDIILGHIRST